MRTLLAVWRILDRQQRYKLVALQFLSVLMAFATVGGMAAVLPFFTALSDPHAVRNHALLRIIDQHMHLPDQGSLLAAVGVVFVLAVFLSNLVNLLGTLKLNAFAFAVGDALHARLFSDYLYRGYEFHLQVNSATLTSNVIHEASRVTSGILRHGLILIANLVAVLFIVGSMLLINPVAAILIISGLGASYGAIYGIARARLLANGRIESENVAERARIVAESFGAIKEIIVLQAQPHFVSKLAQRCRSLSKTIVSTLAIAQGPRYALEFATVCGLVVAALYSHRDGEAVGPWIAQLSFLGMAIYRLLPSLQQMFVAVVRIRADTPAFERIAADLRHAQESKRRSQGAAVDGPWQGRPLREICLRNVTFAHAIERAPAISNLSVSLPAGAIIGFIGVNGSGKTTLVDLICGLLVPQSGQIEIDGITLQQHNREAWQSTIAYIPQNIFICDATLAQNVAFGVSSEQIDADRVREVIRLAQLEQCVRDLPNGYEERLGEHGSRLSGGQRQRLGIARALYRDASLLIMDEATSSLDNAAECELMDMLAAHRSGRTILLGAHRLGALRNCDHVYELAGGGVKELVEGLRSVAATR